MAKISCMICGTPCTWCVWRCRCWMTDRNVLVSNSVLSKKPDYIKDANMMKILIKLVRQWLYDDDIITIMESTDINEISVKEIVEEKVNKLWYCEYPIWSWNQWQWVKCVHCWLERFYGVWKKCSFISKE